MPSSHTNTGTQRREMNEEEAKKSVGGGGAAATLMAKPHSEDRKPMVLPPQPASAASPAPPTPKKVIIKSADMLPDMQKEAVDIAVSVSPNYSFFCSLFPTLPPHFTHFVCFPYSIISGV